MIESSTYCPNKMLDKHGREMRGTDDQPILINDSNMFTPIIKDGVTMDRNGKVLTRTFYLADVESIISSLVVIPDIGNVNKLRYFQVSPREQWANQFTRWLDAPSRFDREEMEEEDDDYGEDNGQSL